MGDKATLSKARQELEDLYAGVPDESVNLTFKDLPSIQQNGVAERKFSSKEVIYENMCKEIKESLSTLSKSGSIDFAKSMQASREYHHAQDEIHCERTPPRMNNGLRSTRVESSLVYDDASTISVSSLPRRNKGLKSGVERSFVYDDASTTSMRSRSPYNERGGRWRPGIPHTNICTVCSQYIYIFRHRCLVCGRAYCRQCVSIGMGEMTEGRKCIECLGRRFSPRYIQRAGNMGCCTRYPSAVKQQELKWAEKGPRRSGERQYGRSMVASRSRSPIGTPNRSQVPGGNTSFVMNTPKYSPNNQPFPPF